MGTRLKTTAWARPFVFRPRDRARSPPSGHWVPGLLGQVRPFRGCARGVAAPAPGPEPPCLCLRPVLVWWAPSCPGSVLLSWTGHHIQGRWVWKRGNACVTRETSRVSSQEGGRERPGGGSPALGSFSRDGLVLFLVCGDRQTLLVTAPPGACRPGALSASDRVSPSPTGRPSP